MRSGGPPVTWELSLKSFEEIIAASGERGQPAVAGSGSGSPGFRRTPAGAAPGGTQPLNDARSQGDDATRDLTAAAAEGFLVNGSVNNGAASPVFAQLAAFGNNRREARSLYNWGHRRDPWQFRLGLPAVFLSPRSRRRSPPGLRRAAARHVRRPIEDSACHEAAVPEYVRCGYQRSSNHSHGTQSRAHADRSRACRRLLADARRTGSARFRSFDPLTGLPFRQSDSAGIESVLKPPRSLATIRCRTSTASMDTTIRRRCSRRTATERRSIALHPDAHLGEGTSSSALSPISETTTDPTTSLDSPTRTAYF